MSVVNRWKTMDNTMRLGYLYWRPQDCAKSFLDKCVYVALSIVAKLGTLFLPYLLCSSLHNRVKYGLQESSVSTGGVCGLSWTSYLLTVSLGSHDKIIHIMEKSEQCLVLGKNRLYHLCNSFRVNTYLSEALSKDTFTLEQIRQKAIKGTL